MENEKYAVIIFGLTPRIEDNITKREKYFKYKGVPCLICIKSESEDLCDRWRKKLSEELQTRTKVVRDSDLTEIIKTVEP